MKRLYFFLFTFFASLTISAGEVTEHQALQKAQQFMQGKKFKQTNLRRAASAAGNAYYVFNAEHNGGFVIVAGDDRVKEILGYSEQGSFDLSKAPSNVRWWLGQYEKAISSLGKGTHRAISRRAETAKEAITPFITTTWGQNYPYNSQCPVINGEYCATGCVATAMAQVINYTKWPESAIGEIAGYTTKTNQIAVPKLEATTFDWNNMTDTDIARLMRYCGQSVKMDYGLGESGSYDANIPGALIGKFGYDNNIRIVYRNGYNSETWENMMYNELKAGRPVIYGGQSGNNGHSFICHGYMDGMYYINWGWDGMFDGYFALTALNPDGNGAYGKDQTAIIGIQKSTGGDIVSSPKVTVTKFTLASDETITRNSNSDNFAGIKVECALQNSFTEAKTVQSGFALYQGTELKSVLGYGNVEFSPGIVITPSSTFALGAGLTDGIYRIVPVYRESESAEWIAAEGSNYRYVEAVIAGNTLTLKVMPDAAHDERLKFNIIAVDDNNREVEVSAVNSSNIVGDITIPSFVEIDGVVYDVVQIATYGFRNCDQMTSIKLPSSIKYMGSHAFAFCKQLKEITLPKSLKLKGFSYVFIGCENLSDVKIEEGNSDFQFVDGALLTSNGTYLWLAEGLQIKNYILPESISNIDYGAFAYNKTLETITLNKVISEIPSQAFSNCTSLKSVAFKGDVEIIGGDAFYECVCLSSITFSSALKKIQSGAFYGCRSLTEITLPTSLSVLGGTAFGECTRLEKVICKKASPIAISEGVFDGVYENATLYVPTGRSQYFRSSVGWSKFSHIEEMDMPDVEISTEPFDNIGENQMLFGYYRTSDYSTGNGLGGSNVGTYKACIGIDKKSIAPFVGSDIKYFRFALTNTNIRNVKFWMGTSKDKQDICIQSIDNIQTGWNVVTLEQPYRIIGDSIFMGIEYYSDKNNNYPLSAPRKGYELGSAFIYGPYGEDGHMMWLDEGSKGYGYSLSMQCIIEGSNIPDYDIHISSKNLYSISQNKYYKTGENCRFNVKLRDWGRYSVRNNFTLAVSVDGTEILSWESPSSISHNVNIAGCEFKIPENLAVGLHTVTISVKSINDEAPTFPLDDSCSQVLRIYKNDLGRQKSLVQYYTSTWCPSASHKYVYSQLIDHPEYSLVSFYNLSDLSCPASDEYYKFVEFVEIVGIDRYFADGDSDNLLGLYNGSLAHNMPSFASIDIESEYDKRKRILNITVKGQRIEELKKLHKDVNLTVFLKEDDVIYPQYDTETNTNIPDYKHQGVLRTNVSEIWGDPIVWNGDNYEMHYSIRLNEEWVADNMHIVAFIGEPFDGSNYNDINVINCNDFAVKDAEQIISIDPIEENVETTFSKQMNGTTNLSNTVIDNTYYNMNATNGDGYDATEQALVLNSTTMPAQMSTVQSALVGDAAVKDNFSGVIFEIPAGQGTITVDAKTIGTHVLNVQVGNGAPTKVTKSERGTVDVTYDVAAATYVYLYASTADGSAAPLHHAATVGANSVLLYGYKVTIGSGTGVNAVTIDKPVDVYTLQGQKVRSGATSLSGLTKGVYIINGRKVVVK